MINPGSSQWKLVEQNQLSADLSTSACHALPDVSDWEQVTAATATNLAQYDIRRAAPDGSSAIDLTVRVNWEVGSTYRGGGAFIRTCWVEVPALFVARGFEVNLGVSVEPPRNVGTATAPIGVLRLTIQGTVASKYWTKNHQHLIAVGGDGRVLN